MADEPDIVGALEAAEILGVHRATVIRWADSGRLPDVTRLAGHTGARLFRRSDVETLRDRQAAPNGEPAA